MVLKKVLIFYGTCSISHGKLHKFHYCELCEIQIVKLHSSNIEMQDNLSEISPDLFCKVDLFCNVRNFSLGECDTDAPSVYRNMDQN